jgi:hypothetical protein
MTKQVVCSPVARVEIHRFGLVVDGRGTGVTRERP